MPERRDGVVVVMTGDILAEFRRPLFAGLWGDFIKAMLPEPQPGGLNLLSRITLPPILILP
jgi:hypothetical protein